MVERPCYPRLSVPGGGNRSLYLWCCVNCGNRIDETIAFHQAQQRECEHDRDESMKPGRVAFHWKKVQDAVARHMQEVGG